MRACICASLCVRVRTCTNYNGGQDVARTHIHTNDDADRDNKV